MPTTGRKPKAPGEARHRVKPVHEWTEVVDQPYDEDVPKLPTRRDNKKWAPRIREKWKVWSSMPHCRLWSAADWEFALDTLEVAAQFHEGDQRLATELRNREKVLGTTADYRRDLRIRYVDVLTEQESKADDVPNLEDYRNRVG